MAKRPEDQRQPEPAISDEEETVLSILEADLGLPEHVCDEIMGLLNAALIAKAEIDDGEARFYVDGGEIDRYNDCYDVIDRYGKRRVARFNGQCAETRKQADDLTAMLNHREYSSEELKG